HLELVVDPTGRNLFSVRIRPESVKEETVGFQTQIGSSPAQVHSFTKTFPDPNGQVAFINIPSHTESLISHFKRGMRVDATAFEGGLKKPLIFSLRGSSATITELQNRCYGARPLADSEFENAFLPSKR